MGTAYKIIVLALLVVGLVFARSGKNNSSRVEEKKVKGSHYWVKGNSENDGIDQIKGKRSHKRRRKVRKPQKGLR